MAEFAYTARNQIGKNVAGTLSAGSKREALAILSEQALFPLQLNDVNEKKKSIAQLFNFKPKKKIKTDVLASTLTQLADLLQNGVPLLKSLQVLVDQDINPVLTEVLQDIHDRIVEGKQLDEAFAKHPEIFGELTISMVKAGSEGAFLEDALKRTANFLELQEELKNRVKGAMAYPMFLGGAGFIVTVVLIVFFVPKFAELFESLEENGGLPTPTVILLGLSDFLGMYGHYLAVVLFAIGFQIRSYLKTEKGHIFMDRWKLKIPVAGDIFLGSAISRFTRVLGTLLVNGVPLIRALEISRDTTGNKILGQAIKASEEHVTAGDTLSKPLNECGLFPKPVMAMINVAEESNNLENVLINISDGIDRRISAQLDIMVKLVEPILLMTMGVIVMFILIALLMPIFDMTAAI